MKETKKKKCNRRNATTGKSDELLLRKHYHTQYTEKAVLTGITFVIGGWDEDDEKPTTGVLCSLYAHVYINKQEATHTKLNSRRKRMFKIFTYYF